MMTFYMMWDQDQRAEFNSLPQLEQLIDQLTVAAQAGGVPLSVVISLSSETSLLITVGREESHLEYYSSTDRPRGVGSRGPWDSSELIEFNHMGESSELEKRYWVPSSAAREAVRRYFHTGTRPDNIAWE